MKPILFSAIAMALFAFTAKDKLVGRWMSQPSVNGNITSVVFKEDSSFDGYVNKKPFVTGTYTLKDGVFTFTDNGCDGKEGAYKVVFFSNEDSMRFQPINDECAGRKAGMERMVLGRVK